MKSTILAISGLILLGGCVTSGGSGAVKPLSADLRSDARITSVVLQNRPGNVSRDFSAAFQSAVQSKLNKCANGDNGLTLTVTLNGYESANPAIALFAPSQSQISGVAQMKDASGAVVGEYNIRRTLMIGGIAGAIVASGAEEHMSNAFGEELCKQAFGA